MRFSAAALALIFAITWTGPAFPEGKELAGVYTPASSVCPTPEEEAKKMSVPEGYEVRCFAHEPMVVNPVAMTWDARGRLWVVEAYEYPEGSQLPLQDQPFNGEAKDTQYRPVPAVCQAKDNPGSADRPDHPKIPKDRIVILEDTDNDGVADKRTVFLEGLNLGSAILCGDGGVYVAQQPHILHFKDTDGDDHADQWRYVLTGFGREDTHELLNSFCWGPDGWMYMTHGVFTSAKVRRPGEPENRGYVFNAGIGRCNPLTGDFEVFADGTSNPWGCDYDAKGNFFVSACVIDHFFHMAPGGIYVRQGGAPENSYSYELLPSIVHHKHFRAAYAGVQIYQGGVYPKDTWGHAFIGNIHDNAVHEEILTPDGASFKCDPRRDFLRANDGWFRPVSTQTGPDGNLWIMDWCDKYPCYQNAKANPDGVDREKGRIWRVVYTGSDKAKAVAAREKKDLDLSKLEVPELTKTLGHSNNWMRRMARRMLVERLRFKYKADDYQVNGPSGKPEPATDWNRIAPDLKLTEERDHGAELLEGVLKSNGDESVRLESLWTLHGSELLQRKSWDYAADDSSPGIRYWAARLAGEHLVSGPSWYALRVTGENPNPPPVVDENLYGLPKLETLCADPDPFVRSASATAARGAFFMMLTTDRNWPVPQPPIVHHQELLSALINANRNTEDRLLTFQVWMALEPELEHCFGKGGQQTIDWLGEILPKSEPLSHSLIEKTMRRLCDTRYAGSIDLIPALLGKVQDHDALLIHALGGLEKGQEAGIVKPAKETGALFAKLLASPNADVRKHAQNLATLWGDPAAVKQLIIRMLDEKAPKEERLADILTARKLRTDEVRAGLKTLLGQKLPDNLTVETLRAAGDLGGDGMPQIIVSSWKSYKPVLRTTAAEALTSRPEWAAKLLNAVEEKKIERGELPITVARYFGTQPDAKLKKRAEDLIGAWHESNADIKALITAKKKACLEGEPDLAQGKIIFQTTCMVCHTFLGTGQKVGPDLTGSGRSNLDALLANVIDPNQIIGNGYENIIVTTKDNRTLSGRMTEDTPDHVKLLAIGGAEQVVARDQVASLTNTHQSVMPLGFGALPDDVFRNLAWYVLAPPDEGPLTKEKKKLLSQGVEGAEAAKKKGPNWHAADWESVSLWNPQWQVIAPEFERTPVKLSDYHGRQNVLLMHPFAKDKPCALERKVTIGKDKLNKLSFYVASHDQGDWELRVKVNDEVVKKQAIDHDGERWKHIEIDLSKYAGKEVTLRLEGAATGWSWEFSYWSDVSLK